jgi:hypothetical protein
MEEACTIPIAKRHGLDGSESDEAFGEGRRKQGDGVNSGGRKGLLLWGFAHCES